METLLPAVDNDNKRTALSKYSHDITATAKQNRWAVGCRAVLEFVLGRHDVHSLRSRRGRRVRLNPGCRLDAGRDASLTVIGEHDILHTPQYADTGKARVRGLHMVPSPTGGGEKRTHLELVYTVGAVSSADVCSGHGLSGQHDSAYWGRCEWAGGEGEGGGEGARGRGG